MITNTIAFLLAVEVQGRRCPSVKPELIEDKKTSEQENVNRVFKSLEFVI